MGMPECASEIMKQLGPAVHMGRERKKPKIDPGELYTGDMTLEQILHVAKVMTVAGKNKARTVAGMVKTVVGTLSSFGKNMTVEGVSCKEYTQMINAGEVDLPDTLEDP